MADYDKDAVQRRLRRIEGQIKGIQRMIDEERGCNDILIQISAVRSAVNRVGGIVLENHLKHCMTKCKSEDSKKEQTIDELIETMIGSEAVSFNDIERLAFGYREPPKLLIKAGFLLSIFNWRAAGPTLLVATTEYPVLCIVMGNGKQRKFSLKALYHMENLIEVAKKAGIPVDPELEPSDDQ